MMALTKTPDSMTLYELQGYFSDYYKDTFGFRPRYGSQEQWASKEWLLNEIHYLEGVKE